MAEIKSKSSITNDQKCAINKSKGSEYYSEVMQPSLSHKQKKAVRKKERRKSKRQEIAQEQERISKEAQNESPYHQLHVQRECEQELYGEECRERDRQLQHSLWIERERLALQQIAANKYRQELSQKKQEEEEQRIREEWQERQRKEKEDKREQEEKDKAKKDKKDALMKEARSGENAKDEGSWHNPLAPANYGQEAPICPFFAKTGACRYGERCSRSHPFPDSSCTLLFRGMYVHFGLLEGLQDEFDLDITLEYEDRETYQHFRDFYDDVLPEFRQLGKVVQLKVCCNYEPHLRGNVYVQYKREDDAHQAFIRLNARWYAGRQLQCEFCSVTRWKNAICGQFRTKKCPKGKNCNFLHVFRNPGGEFWEADRDYNFSEPRSDRHHNWSQRSSLPRDRPRLPNWDRQRSSRRSSSRSPNKHRKRRSRSQSPIRGSARRSRSRSPFRGSTRKSRSRSRSPKQTRTRSHRNARKSRSRSPSRFRSSRSRVRESSYRRSRSPGDRTPSWPDNKWNSDSDEDVNRDNRCKLNTNQRRLNKLAHVNGAHQTSVSPPSHREVDPSGLRNPSRSQSPEETKHKRKKHKKVKKHKNNRRDVEANGVSKKQSPERTRPETVQHSVNVTDKDRDNFDGENDEDLDQIQKDCIKQIKDCIQKVNKDSLLRGIADTTTTTDMAQVNLELGAPPLREVIPEVIPDTGPDGNVILTDTVAHHS